MNYSIGLYYDQETGRKRWAVYGGVWYFPARYGVKAARALCNRLNGGAQ